LAPSGVFCQSNWSVICVVGLRSLARSFGGTSTAELAWLSPSGGCLTSGRTECDSALKSGSKVRCWRASVRQRWRNALRSGPLTEVRCQAYECDLRSLFGNVYSLGNGRRRAGRGKETGTDRGFEPTLQVSSGWAPSGASVACCTERRAKREVELQALAFGTAVSAPLPHLHGRTYISRC